METTPRGNQVLAPREVTGGRPETTGRGTWDPNKPKIGGGGGGVAWPLTEPSFAAREYWPTGLWSSDGILMIPAPKTIHLVDADGTEGALNLANPVAP
ncbi:hypothetical protein [Pseudomonas sp. BN515]|uniref:hypothetical protein n=1 Tax=Pseudomonas sp. BN515 TaxID=2567892 RepID=UPI0024538E62|nr:hypothetical protein [Pseudomonas sp. BN515]MDH4873011.1 hypothetical protein [Pseudomonas sp. BN515]